MGKMISNESIASITLELSMLLHAGIGAGDALALLEEEAEYKDILKGITEKADSGASLADCLKKAVNFRRMCAVS